ncbi:hypothetical protein Tco_0700974 [Tanacetum coccineum]
MLSAHKPVRAGLHLQTNGKAEVANRKIMKGVEKRMKENKRCSVDEPLIANHKVSAHKPVRARLHSQANNEAVSTNPIPESNWVSTLRRKVVIYKKSQVGGGDVGGCGGWWWVAVMVVVVVGGVVSVGGGVGGWWWWLWWVVGGGGGDGRW